ncbi:MAG: flagellar export chaperone FlgN [Lachnospiraceae bacterium]|nr:flagellar export chaperone FlgN [Lachnospiraceae bacterium]
MDQNYVIILEESLIQKNKVLDEIKSLCEEQGRVIADDMQLEALDSYIEKKGILIEQLEKLDEGFESLYEKVSEEIKRDREKYAVQIRHMQSLISEITDKSNAIQAQEERNRSLINNYFGKRRSEVKEGRVNSKVAMNYYKVQSNSSFVDAQFMDSKK